MRIVVALGGNALLRRGEPMTAEAQRANVQIAAARAWSVWEGSTLSLLQDPERVRLFGADTYAIAFARIECHYFINRGFFERDDQLLRGVDRIRHLPCVMVHGRYDVVTPVKNAWDLSRAWRQADLRIVGDAGHAMTEPGIVHELVGATRKFAGGAGRSCDRLSGARSDHPIEPPPGRRRAWRPALRQIRSRAECHRAAGTQRQPAGGSPGPVKTPLGPR